MNLPLIQIWVQVLKVPRRPVILGVVARIRGTQPTRERLTFGEDD